MWILPQRPQGLARGPVAQTPFRFLRQGLESLGHGEGSGLVIEYRSGKERAQLAERAAELVRLNVELLVTPVSYSGDPVEAGFVRASGARAGT